MGSLPNRTAQRKRVFLEAFGEVGIITRACEAAGVGRTTVYEWQEHDEEFAHQFRQAELRATEVLETEARRRAVNEGSDTLLIFLLKARAPEKYRERHDVTTGGQPIQAAGAGLDAAIERRLAEMAARGESPRPVAAHGPAESEDAFG